MTGPDKASLAMTSSPKGPLPPDASGTWASLSGASCSSSGSTSPSEKARFGSALHSPAAAKRHGAMSYCGAFHSPRDLHPIKYFLSSAEDTPEDRHGSVGRRLAHRQHRRRQMKQNSCTSEELSDMADSPGTADEFGRSKSEGKYCQRPQRRNPNPILAELQRLERTDSPVLEPFGRSQSEPVGPNAQAPVGSPSPSPGPSPVRTPRPARRRSNPIMQELERLERRDSLAHLNAAEPWAETRPSYLSHPSTGFASPLGRVIPTGGSSPGPRPSTSHGAGPGQAGSSLAPEDLLLRVSSSGAASPRGTGLGRPPASPGHAGLVTAASLDVEARRKRGGNPIMRELERLERQSSWAGQSWEHQRVFPSGQGRGTPQAYQDLPTASSESYTSTSAMAASGSEPMVYPRGPSGLASSRPWGSASEEPSLESLRVIRHRRGVPILHDLDLSFLQPDFASSSVALAGDPSPGSPGGLDTAFAAPVPAHAPGAALGATWGAPEARAGLQRESSMGGSWGGEGKDSPRSELTGETQGMPQVSRGWSLRPRRSLSLTRAFRSSAWAEEPSAVGSTLGALIPEGGALIPEGGAQGAAVPAAQGQHIINAVPRRVAAAHARADAIPRSAPILEAPREPEGEEGQAASESSAMGAPWDGHLWRHNSLNPARALAPHLSEASPLSAQRPTTPSFAASTAPFSMPHAASPSNLLGASQMPPANDLGQASGPLGLPHAYRPADCTSLSTLESLDETLGLPSATVAGAPGLGQGMPAAHQGRPRGILGRSFLGYKGGGEEGKCEGVPLAGDSGAGCTEEGRKGLWGEPAKATPQGTPQAGPGDTGDSRGPWRTSSGVKSASAGEIPLEHPQSNPPTSMGAGQLAPASATVGATTGMAATATAAGLGTGSGMNKAGEGSGTPKGLAPSQPRASRFLFRMKSAQLA